MRDDYLWSGSGDPDPEIAELETKLAKFRGRAPAMPRLTAERERGSRWSFPGGAWWPRLATAAAILFVVTAVVIERGKHEGTTGGPAKAVESWEVVRLAGAPRVGSEATGDAGKLGVGQTLETDGESRASIVVDDLGQLEIEPNSRLRLLSSSSKRKWIALDRGTIKATIWAPAGQFVVDTPAATAVDLGCAYTLKVDDSGSGILKTTLGWVGFKLDDREAFIPAGAACPLHAKTGPGTPYFEDASAQFRSALETFDDPGASASAKQSALTTLLAASRKRDALTLWHLLSRVSAEDRIIVYERLSSLVPPPEGVTRERILNLEDAALDQWWNAFGLGDIALFRTWERTWSTSPLANVR